MLTQHVAGRDLGNAVALFEQLGLRSLPGSWCSQENNGADAFPLLLPRLFHNTPKTSCRSHQSVLSGSLPRTGELTPASSDSSTLGREALVVSHDQLRFHLIDRVHRHANHNQQRRASEIELHAQAFQDEAWKMLVNRSSQRPGKMVQMDARNHPFRYHGDHRSEEHT